jgi:hypothetical protein
MTIGHPDFLAAVSPAPPQFIQALGPFGAGGNWGPVNVQVPSGGSYHLAIFPTDTNKFVCTDVVISHLDSRGIPTWQDFFGGVLAGNGLPGLQGNCNAAVVRGNIYGSTLQISGTAAASAFLNAVIPGHAFVATGLNVNVYTTPFALADPQPHVAAAAANINSFLSDTPQGLLAVINAAVITHATSSPFVPLLAYAGPATLEIEQEGVNTGGNVLLNLNGYTVSGGSANVINPRRYKPLPPNQNLTFPLQLQPMLHVYSVTNNDGAQDATVLMSLTAAKAA